MNVPVLDNPNVIDVDARVAHCVREGCGGAVVRHSLGGGQSIYRCTRCFRRYQVRPSVAVVPEQPQPGRFRRFLNDFVSWRDD